MVSVSVAHLGLEKTEIPDHRVSTAQTAGSQVAIHSTRWISPTALNDLRPLEKPEERWRTQAAVVLPGKSGNRYEPTRELPQNAVAEGAFPRMKQNAAKCDPSPKNCIAPTKNVPRTFCWLKAAIHPKSTKTAHGFSRSGECLVTRHLSYHRAIHSQFVPCHSLGSCLPEAEASVGDHAERTSHCCRGTRA